MANIECRKCGKSKRPENFFKLKNSEPCDICKDCLTMYIKNDEPDTFLWILEMFDVPYIQDEWIKQVNKTFEKNPGKYKKPANAPALGMYLRCMKMKQWKEYGFKDSDMLNFKAEKERQEAEARRIANRDEAKEADLLQRLNNGEISQAEYNTLSSYTEGSAEIEQERPQIKQVIAGVDESEISKQLSEDDIHYLAVKWGITYQPSEWIKMEQLYNEYANEYELNVDREETVKKICKISLKMDQALDTGDIKTAKDYGSIYDQLRKSGKFTESQKKDEAKRELDSIGELVQFVEREGGIIPQFEDPIEYPKDKIDFIIKDIQNYINNLVRDELGLGNIIEAYVQKLENNKASSVEEIMEKGFEPAEEDMLSTEDIERFSEFQASEIEAEAQALLEDFE